ncbi:alpha/beta hydrolase [Acinetobacter radioresistens]|uniref:esterase/lipase family protein n=1 Tax=Acinetobacter radioresistens TaxID=40216 RepID=UPI0034D73108
MFRNKINRIWLLSTLSVVLLSGCQVVSVKQQALNISIANERDSILTRDRMSEASLNVLSMTGREAEACTEKPDECIKELEQIPQIMDEQMLSAASEIYLAKSLELSGGAECTAPKSKGDSTKAIEKRKLQEQNYNQCLDQQLNLLDKSIRYSYAYLFKTERHPEDRIFDNRQVQIRDFYNQALAKLVTTYSLRHPSKTVSPQIKVGKSIYSINVDQYPQLKNQPLEQLLSSYNLNFSGLRSINRRDGFGSEFVVVLPQEERKEVDKYILDPMNFSYENGVNPNIHKARYLAVTITAQPKTESSIEEILNSPHFQLNVYDPYSTEKVKVGGENYPLAANFSAPYGLWLAQNNLGIAAYLTLLDRRQDLTMPHLYMLEPYNPDKKVIVLVHGLASSPEAWIAVTNDIMGDNVLREHYQVWQVFYSTNMPIIESRFQIYALLQQAFKNLDPNAPSAKDAVLIGHSMGGIISRLLVSQADLSETALQKMNSYQLVQYRNEPMIRERLRLQPINNFTRAVFLATPHKGTRYADRWFTLAARKIIRIPGTFVNAIGESLRNDDLSIKDILQQVDRSLIQNGPSNLSYKSKFIDLTEDVMPVDGLVYHSILGNNTDSQDPNVITDGVVTYQSAHLEGAASEKIFKGGHSIQITPETILELRRILRQHLTELGLYHPDEIKIESP